MSDGGHSRLREEQVDTESAEPPSIVGLRSSLDSDKLSALFRTSQSLFRLNAGLPSSCWPASARVRWECACPCEFVSRRVDRETSREYTMNPSNPYRRAPNESAGVVTGEPNSSLE